MLKFSLILGLCLISSIMSSTVQFYDLALNTKTAMKLEDDSKIPKDAEYYFKVNYVNNLQLLLSVPNDASISFEIGVASFTEDPSDQEISDSDFTVISTYEKSAEDTEDVFSYSLAEATDKEKPFVVLKIKNLQEIELYNVLVKNADTPQGVQVYNLEFNQEVGLDGEVKTPLYLKVSISEPITQKKISFNLKVPKSTLSGATVYVSGYSAEPNMQDFSENVIDTIVDSQSEVSQDGDSDVNKYSVDNIAGATYLIIKVETDSPLELKSVFVKVYAEDEEEPKEEEKEK